MIKKKFRIAIIGAGYMAEEYLRILLYKKIQCEAIYSRTFIKSKLLKKKYNIKKICKNLNDLKFDKKINALIIAVNEVSTVSILNELDISNYKILCEKPVGVNYDQTKKLISKIKNNHFYIGLNRRFYSSNIKAKKIIDMKKGKRFISIRDQQFQNSKINFVNKNIMYCNSVHLIDYINLYARGELVKVQRLKKLKDYEFSENITRLIFSSKDEVLYHCNWNSPGIWSVNIIQKDQRCEMKPLEDLIQEKIIKGKRKRFLFKKSKIDNNFKPGLFLQVNEYLKMLTNKKHKLINIKDYFKTVKIIKKIYV